MNPARQVVLHKLTHEEEDQWRRGSDVIVAMHNSVPLMRTFNSTKLIVYDTIFWINLDYTMRSAENTT